MTNARPQAAIENVGGGTILALLAIPVGVIILVLVSSIGIFASVVGFVVAISAVWLYRRGSGGIISRTGAWTVTVIVLATLLIGIWISLVVIEAGGLGHLDVVTDPRYLQAFNTHFSQVLSDNALFIVLVLLFGILGAFRTLGRAFATAHVSASPTATFGSSIESTTVTPTVYQNDVDSAPTGSADDKTPPPTAGR
jgi:hypothetical protein